MIKATARVRLVIDIKVDDSWGPDCSIEQITKQAIDSATTSIMKGLSINYLIIGSDPKCPASIIGKPEVTTIILIRDEE